jgi:hypothetical protein
MNQMQHAIDFDDWSERLQLRPAPGEEARWGADDVTGAPAHESLTEWCRRRVMPTREQQTILVLLAVQFSFIVLFYWTKWTRVIIYPLSILATIFHEVRGLS